MTTDRSHMEALSAALVQVLSTRNDVTAAYVFGSYVTGPRTAESDVDIAVLFSGSVAKVDQLSLQQDISDRLKVQADLVDLGRAPVVLRMQVLRKGEKILDRNPSATTAFVVRSSITTTSVSSNPWRTTCSGGESMVDRDVVLRKVGNIQRCLKRYKRM